MFLTKARDETSFRPILENDESTWSALEVQLPLPWLYAHIEESHLEGISGRTFIFQSAIQLVEVLKAGSTRLVELQVLVPPLLPLQSWRIVSVDEIHTTSIATLFIYHLADGTSLKSAPMELKPEALEGHVLLKVNRLGRQKSH